MAKEAMPRMLCRLSYTTLFAYVLILVALPYASIMLLFRCVNKSKNSSKGCTVATRVRWVSLMARGFLISQL